MIIGQMLSLVGIVALLIQTARWISKKHVSRDFSFFIVTVLVIASMQIFSILRFDMQQSQLTDIEYQNSVLLSKQQKMLNQTLANQGLIKSTLSEARQDEIRAVSALNQTRHNDEILHQILGDIHLHVSNQTLNSSQLRTFDTDRDIR